MCKITYIAVDGVHPSLGVWHNKLAVISAERERLYY